MTVIEYEREFVRLSKYAQECVSSEAKMRRRFEDRLNEDIRLSMGVLELKEFLVLINRACKAEELIKEKKKIDAETRDARKRHSSESFPSQSKKSRDVYSRSHVSAGHSYRDHKKQESDSKSRDTSVASVDHFIKDCLEMNGKEKFQSARPSGTNSKESPQKNVGIGASSKNVMRDTTRRSEARTPTRTYAIRAREDTSSPDVITVRGYCLSADLMLLPFNEFDVILGMEWLTLHDAVINCRQKVIKLKCENGETLWVKSNEPKNFPIVISSKFAQKCLRKGCEAYLAIIMNTKESELKVEIVPVVCEYADVFQEELSELPPNREIEFGIELMLGTTPISIAPY
ncbi:uncharacterized protein [Gossypium hirsutum]|uniref:Gag-Pol polyprotein n=1 Tax=Gossypium hirsutum TaxID=3635 RepID=A0A1U8NFM3_GOSHI|nr:uncharacterized protein LOC107947778 [Gossypium hirsutum]